MKSRKFLEGQARSILDSWSKHEIIRELLNQMNVNELDDFISDNE